MGSHNLHCTLILSHILLFFFIHNIAAGGSTSTATNELSRVTLRDDAEDPCAKASCGQGACVASLLGFDCVCKPGWSKMQLGPIVFPACTVPNCTINSQCGNGAPPPPPAPPPPFNLFNPCNLVWCGDGTCVPNPNGLGYYCKCNNGSANLFNLTGVACLKECYLGADCKGVTFGSPSSPPPPLPPASSNAANCSTSPGSVILMLLSLIFLARSM
ncbi:uncharacterized protein [Coffea arabica]|uniref:Uncharacterized protein isoform X2 n=1 Tax=Coffea arabica TaxID=13443 RepID=A0ABM4U2P0_COFAR